MPDLRLDSRVIAISGAGGGIGRALAMDLARRGAAIVVNDYGTNLSGSEAGDVRPAQRVVQEIREAGGKASAVIADVGDETGAARVIDAAIDDFGRIDGLIHAACVFPPLCAFEDMKRSDFDKTLNVTVNGAWGLCQAAWPRFKAQKYGRIVLIQSAAGFYGRIGMPAYSMAKSSFIGFTSLLAQEGAPHGILVNNLSPVGWSRAAAREEGLGYMEQSMPAEALAPLVALLMHPGFDRSGLLLHSGGGVVTRMFIPETRGVVFPRSDVTAAEIGARIGEILDERDYRRPATTDDVGRSLFEAVAARDGVGPAST